MNPVAGSLYVSMVQVDELIRFSRGMQTSSNGPPFVIVLFTPVEEIGRTIKKFCDEDWKCQSLYWTNRPSTDDKSIHSQCHS